MSDQVEIALIGAVPLTLTAIGLLITAFWTSAFWRPRKRLRPRATWRGAQRLRQRRRN